MLPVNLLNALKEYSVASQRTPLPTGAADAAAKTGLQLEVGQKVQGTVQAQVATNIFKVSVSGQLVQMELPPSIRSGDTVALQVIALQPRLAFSMASSEKPLSTPEQLGSTARMLSSLSQQTPEKAYVRAAQSTPLWETPQPPETKQLAGMLQEALSNSGLFYESHQAQWLGGDRSTTQLMQEPQNMTPEQARAVTKEFSGNRTNVASDMTTGNAVEESNNHGKTGVANNTSEKSVVTENATNKAVMSNNNVHSEASARNAGSTNPPNQLNSSSPSDAKPLGIPDHLQPLVQQQLNALETNQMMWQGNVWPGQDMQWEVHEQATQHPDVEGQRQWVTQIQLDLPNLGPVAATLRLNSAGLSLTLNADTPQTRSVLGNASSRLVSALSDSGISVLSTKVTQ